MDYIVTSESVNKGHPDKTCDIIADSFLDEALKQDPSAQMAVECVIKNNLLMIFGEATTTAKIDYEKIARDCLKEIGYKNEFVFIKEVSAQSPDIEKAVKGKVLKANDQGIVFGYATNETKELMPLPILLAHKLMFEYEQFRLKNQDRYFSDAKSQVSVVYDKHNKIKKIHTILVSVSHCDSLSNKQIKEDITQNVIEPVLEQYNQFCSSDVKLLINTSGKFTVWGSVGDSGCVGRKIVVDAYGMSAKVGGGAFSSKNATKVDRSGAYFARYIAKNIVAAGLADRCELNLSFAIGKESPVSMMVECFGTNKKPLKEIEQIIKNNFDFKLGSIIEELGLLNPIYKQTACYGHFGREGFAWERVKQLRV